MPLNKNHLALRVRCLPVSYFFTLLPPCISFRCDRDSQAGSFFMVQLFRHSHCLIWGSQRILLYHHKPVCVPLGQALTVEHAIRLWCSSLVNVRLLKGVSPPSRDEWTNGLSLQVSLSTLKHTRTYTIKCKYKHSVGKYKCRWTVKMAKTQIQVCALPHTHSTYRLFNDSS